MSNQRTKRNLAVLLIAMAVLVAGVTVADWAKKPDGGGGKPGGGEEPPRYTQVDLGTLGGSGCSAYGINDAGQVVGASTTDAEVSHAFLLIPEYDGAGDPVVWYRDEDGPDGEPDGANDLMMDIGTLPGDLSGHAFGVNDSGQVVGTSRGSVVGKDHSRAFVWEDSNGNSQSDPGEMIDLGTLGGDHSEANSINNLGQVVGWATDADVYRRAFLVAPEYDDGNPVWFRDDDNDGANDLMIDLGTLGGRSSSAAFINDSGQVVGRADTSATDRDGWFIEHAFLITPEYDSEGNPVVWFRDDTGPGGEGPPDGVNDLMIDLGTLGGPASVAVAMNDSGQIAGTAQINGNTAYAFLLTPADRTGPEGVPDGVPDTWFEDENRDGANDLMTDLGILKGTANSNSSDLNNKAQVVGYCWKNPGSRNNVVKRFLWENGQMKDLDGLTDSDVGIGAWIGGINNAGQIVTSGGYILVPIPEAP